MASESEEIRIQKLKLRLQKAQQKLKKKKLEALKKERAEEDRLRKLWVDKVSAISLALFYPLPVELIKEKFEELARNINQSQQ